jgi:hypothetical protein
MVLRHFSVPLSRTGRGQGATRPGQVLAAFKAAAPHLGLNPRIVHAVDWLFTFTQPQDWCEGSRPVVWPYLGVSKPLWGDACLAMGREKAAIALAIVSAKPVEHFTTSPGSYFFGMVTRAKAGKLNLARTIWSLRETPRREAGASGRPDRARGESLNS